MIAFRRFAGARIPYQLVSWNNPGQVQSSRTSFNEAALQHPTLLPNTSLNDTSQMWTWPDLARLIPINSRWRTGHERSSVPDSVIRTGATQHMTALRQLQEFSAFLNSDCVHFSSISTDVTLAKLTRHPMIRAQKGSLCADLQRRNTPRVHVLQRRIAHRTSKGQHHPAQVPAGFPMIARWAATRDQSVWCPDGFQPLEVS
jgi:hypothetical protein